MRRLDDWAVKGGLPLIAGLLAAALSAAVVQTYVTITHDKGPGGFSPSEVPSEGAASGVTTTTVPAASTTTTVSATGQVPASTTTTSAASTRTRTGTSPVTLAAPTTTTSTTAEIHGNKGDTPGAGRGGGPGGGDD